MSEPRDIERAQQLVNAELAQPTENGLVRAIAAALTRTRNTALEEAATMIGGLTEGKSVDFCGGLILAAAKVRALMSARTEPEGETT